MVKRDASRIAISLIATLFSGGGMFFASALAQSGVYENTTTGTYGNSAATQCASGNWLTRTIIVPDTFLIADVNLGFQASHAWRTDTNLQLQSPAGTVVDLLTGTYSGSWNNYNVLFDDAAAIQVDTGAHQANDPLTPDYVSVVRSEGGNLSAFNGEQGNGTWTLRICDVYGPADDGVFQRARLFFTAVPQAVLSPTKSNVIYDPAALGLYAVPGNDMIYTITVTNTGTGPADTDSIEIIDALPPEVTFYNGDIDDAGPEVNPVSFSQTGAGLTFTYATDIAFSNAVTKPANFAACTYTPAAGYDPAVTFICFNPKGAMASGTPDPLFSLSFRARID